MRAKNEKNFELNSHDSLLCISAEGFEEFLSPSVPEDIKAVCLATIDTKI